MSSARDAELPFRAKAKRTCGSCSRDRNAAELAREGTVAGELSPGRRYAPWSPITLLRR